MHAGLHTAAVHAIDGGAVVTARDVNVEHLGGRGPGTVGDGDGDGDVTGLARP